MREKQSTSFMDGLKQHCKVHQGHSIGCNSLEIHVAVDSEKKSSLPYHQAYEPKVKAEILKVLVLFT